MGFFFFLPFPYVLIIEQNPRSFLLHKSVGTKQCSSPCPAWLDQRRWAWSREMLFWPPVGAGNAQPQGSHGVLGSFSLSHRHDSLAEHAKTGSICSWDSPIQVSLPFWSFHRDCRGTIHLLALQNELCWTFAPSLVFFFRFN